MFDLKLDNKNTGLVAMSNDISKSRYKLSLPTQKLILFLISEIKYEERKKGVFINDQSHLLSDIYGFLKQSGRKNDKNLKGHLINCINELKTNSISLMKEQRYIDCPWYSRIELNEEDNSFLFKFNNEISPLLLNLKERYFKSNIKEYVTLKSLHSIDLYVLLRAEAFSNPHLKYSLIDLKEALKVTKKKSYQRWDTFKSDILEKSIRQLNKETNYFFSYDIERVGRKVGFVIFTMIEKKDTKKLTELVTEKFEGLLKEQNLLHVFRAKKLHKILYKYDPIEDSLTLGLKNTVLNKKTIPDFDSWLIKIGFTKKITSKIFRKSTKLIYVGYSND